ncbi:MAG: beta-ketoacyl-[acyl-carrier-protein] synthase family protein [Citrobacter sp.]|jgi:3-oxoacyl-[acyl-carrier-protein] synthase II|nr:MULTISPECIES: beta-ketoacyl-[acyl-carrier-protein] synthase family protein [Bacillota]MDU0937030.1 beta-ketoacyl-[acyl-carrier-protein] synthase family protein [Dermabacter sp.]MDU1109602.1 beta-ketoacyl-[acyl-carrier-protein] synthase family protein [Staphylococcus epidermidis]MDU1185537.1 beta-ketoacyl-[acyl-carrier-protein] synthase family protein [Citrobacter sp.]MCI2768008.1 beta-ketoacyl-[acyl-carrier-protein] synthase family protein [Staphylococcus warneri]MCI2787726.1 beta-ketoacyl-
MRKRVVITGLGAVSPLGIGHQNFWENICAGKNGITDINYFDVSNFSIKKGGEIKDFDINNYFDSQKRYDQLSRTCQFSLLATKLAMEDAGLANHCDAKIGVCMGTTMGNQSIIEDDLTSRLKYHSTQNNIEFYPSTNISATVSKYLKASGPSITIPTACAAGNYAISYGAEMIKDEKVDMAYVGGADGLSRSCFALFHRLGAMSPDFCRPFDKNRQGMMVSEGAGVLVLESLESALNRNAYIYAEIIGHGLSCDAYHSTAPHPEGLGATLAMLKALKSANIKANEVSYISAHGTGTKANDSTESKALYRVFKEYTDRIPVSSLKSMIGHTMGAASGLEAISSVLTIKNNTIPPTINYTCPDSDCIKNVVPNHKINKDINIVLSNSFAFGGNICSIVFGGVKNG